MKVLYDKVMITFKGFDPEKTHVIQIEQSLFARWDVTINERITLIAGSNQASLLVRPFSAKKPMIQISRHISHQLSLPILPFPVQITYNKEKRELRIGPFLSVLTDHPIEKMNGTFGTMETFLQEMKTLCEQKGFPFYVHKLQAAKDAGHVEGYWNVNEGWEHRSLPLPDVVYNRIHSRAQEKSAAFQDYLNELHALNIPIFNGGFLSKKEVHEILADKEELLPFLPDTIPLNKEEDFSAFIEKHHVVYVKPSFGSQGKNICKLTETAEGWVLEHSKDIKDTYLFATVTELFAVLKRTIKHRSFIVQKGIPLLEFDHKKIDFRILLNKSKNQSWKITSLVARIGNAGHIVSNLSRGGEMKNAADFLKSAFTENEALTLYKEISKLALQTANCVIEQRADLFGELGIDIALDTNKQPWIIEVNSKPSKAFQGSYEKFRPSVKSIIEYMHSLYDGGKPTRP
ncbi:YheC/YheD family protein [Peribacillus cavernae]|nr:YheC/YheD family protein [Peribacillus cavernae]MDQ0217629.1 glutathione synthase/RimK-type ligase-like ATP-grasp enzyme [Peribacillus cavernae]